LTEVPVKGKTTITGLVSWAIAMRGTKKIRKKIFLSFFNYTATGVQTQYGGNSPIQGYAKRILLGYVGGKTE